MLTDGITNKLVSCRSKEEPETSTVLVRVYGNKTDLLIDRKAETRNIFMLNKEGFASSLYATFENGLVYGYIPGCTLDENTIRDPCISNLVAVHLSKLHKVQLHDNMSKQPFIWNKIEAFIKLVPDRFSDEIKHKRFEELVLPELAIREELRILKIELEKLNSPIVFSHNDLLLKNIIYSSESNSVAFIDYEYAAYNYQAFDIGNHFAEFAGVDNIDYSRYPNKEFQWKWLEAYLSQDGHMEVQERDIEGLYVHVNKFMLLSHIFWGIWALIQAEHSYINFDFIGYAAARFNEYLRKKHEYLPLTVPE